jgi:lysophospholipase L1-like esterase
MIDCLVLGDSIAVGISQVRKECVAYAKSGINSKDFYNKHKRMLSEPKTTGVTIISIGPNDTQTIDTTKYANLIRENIKGKVYWVLPSEKLKPQKVKEIRAVAKVWGDIVLERPADKISPDGVHPTFAGYKELAEKAKRK